MNTAENNIRDTTDTTAHVIHAELQQVFDEHHSPSHASKRVMHDTMGPILEATALAQLQVARYRQLLHAAYTAPHNHVVDGKIAFIRNVLSAIEQNVAQLAKYSHESAEGFVNLEAVMTSAQLDLVTHAAANPPAAPVTVDPAAQRPNKLELRAAAARAAE